MKLEIRHGEQKHEVTVDRLGDLPPELRGHVQAFVMQLPMRVNMAIVQRQIQELPQPRINPAPRTEAKPESKPAENPKLPPKPAPAGAQPEHSPIVAGNETSGQTPECERERNQIDDGQARDEDRARLAKHPDHGKEG